jgi:hypothetical protein
MLIGHIIEEKDLQKYSMECSIVCGRNMDINRSNEKQNSGIWNVDTEKNVENQLEGQNIQWAGFEEGQKAKNDIEQINRKKDEIDRSRVETYWVNGDSTKGKNGTLGTKWSHRIKLLDDSMNIQTYCSDDENIWRQKTLD